VKKSIDEGYKQKRNLGHSTSFISTIKTITPFLPHYNLVTAEGMEADDISFCLIKKLNSCVMLTNDSDWLINFIAADNVRLSDNKETVHQSNFYIKYGFPVHKIPLYLFLKGDSKDSVKKPFRIKGDIVESSNQYDSIEDYCKKNELSGEDVEKYKKLIFPFTNVNMVITEGKRGEHTRDIINKYKLTWMKSYNTKQKRLLE